MTDRIDIAIRYLWTAYGLTYRPIVAIVAVMAEDEKRIFEDALEWWAQYEAEGKPYAWPASRLSRRQGRSGKWVYRNRCYLTSRNMQVSTGFSQAGTR